MGTIDYAVVEIMIYVTLEVNRIIVLQYGDRSSDVFAQDCAVRRVRQHHVKLFVRFGQLRITQKTLSSMNTFPDS